MLAERPQNPPGSVFDDANHEYAIISSVAYMILWVWGSSVHYVNDQVELLDPRFMTALTTTRISFPYQILRENFPPIEFSRMLNILIIISYSSLY